MDREAVMKELDGILESHGIAVDRDAIKEDIFKVVDSAYSEGWEGGRSSGWSDGYDEGYVAGTEENDPC